MDGLEGLIAIDQMDNLPFVACKFLGGLVAV